MEFGEKVKSQLTWVEANSKFPEHMPQKTVEGIKIEMALLEFCRKYFVRLNNEIDNTLEKCNDFYKKIRRFYEKCKLSLETKITDLPDKDQHMAHLQDRIQEDVQHIQKMEVVNKEYVKTLVA